MPEFQQTPLIVIAVPPSELISPPDIAEFASMLVIPEVVNFGPVIDVSFLQLDRRITDNPIENTILKKNLLLIVKVIELVISMY